MFSKTIYWICTVVLFLGLLWMFLPHAAHNAIVFEIEHEEEETEHYEHVIQGLIPTLLALAGMIWNEKKGKKPSSKK